MSASHPSAVDSSAMRNRDRPGCCSDGSCPYRFCPAVSGRKSAVAEHVTADPAARVLRGNSRKADPVFHFGGFTWLMTEGQAHCPV